MIFKYVGEATDFFQQFTIGETTGIVIGMIAFPARNKWEMKMDAKVYW